MRSLIRWLAPCLSVACQPVLDSPTPSVSSVDPPLVCNEQLSSVVTVRGDGLSPVVTDTLGDPTLELPDLSLVHAGTIDGGAATGAIVDLDEGPSGVVQWLDDATMTFEVTPELGLGEAIWDVVVRNPDGQTATQARGFASIAAPTIDALVPEAICVDAGDRALTIEGTGFLVYDGATPTVFIDGDAYAAAFTLGCVELAAVPAAQLCTSLEITVPGDTYAVGGHEVIVENPAPAACRTSAAATLTITEPPTIEAVEPDDVCDTGGTVTITGTGFREGATAAIGDVQATSVTVVSETRIDATFTALPSGLQSVTVANADGCDAQADAMIEVVPAPLLFWVDPPVVYSEVAVAATVYLTGVTGTITDVTLVAADGAETTLSFTWDASEADELVATIPAGLAEGTYDLRVVQDGTCPATLIGAVYVEADVGVAIEAVEPAWAWTGDTTAVSVHATDPAPSGLVQFADVPRVYLNPTSGAGTATGLASVSYADATLLRAVVPAGLDVGTYDVLVINPDGAVGFLAAGLEVTAEPPPTIDAISPASVPSGGDQALTIRGADFRAPTVSFECVDPGTGATTGASGTVTASTATAIDALLPTDTTGNGVCVVTVTNSDGPSVSFAAVSVTNPSQNLYPWAAGASMLTARRAPAAIAGRATSASRYLYAIGGDDGTEAGAMASIEAAAVDAYGSLSDWSELPGTLPGPLTLAGVAKIGRFVYLVGGHDGAAPVDTVWRAQVLDPLAAPAFDDLSIDYGTGVELGGGTWIYRVAALFDATDAANPGGESLASDPIVVRLPDIAERIALTLTWSEVSGASGYRVYRSPAADSGSGAEVWLADVSGGTTLSYTDDNGDTPDASLTPLPEGALGEWAEMPSLPSPLRSPCVTVAVDPADPNTTYLYAAGGLDDSGAVHDAIRLLPITTVSDSEQTPGAWSEASVTLADAAYECGAWAADASVNSVIPSGETWLYFGGGRTAAGTTGAISAGRVQAGGDLADAQAVEGMNPERAGFGAAVASNFLYVFGGQKGAPSNGGRSTEILGPPDLDNWNSLGTSMTEDRYLAGSAQESSVLFQLGGQTSSAAATATVDSCNY